MMSERRLDELERGLASARRRAEDAEARLAVIERRAQQVRGGLKPYARPPEVVDFLLGTEEK